MRLIAWAAIATALSTPSVMGVKLEDWRTCSQSSFCRRLRSIGTRQAAAPAGAFTSPYSVGHVSSTIGVSSDDASWTWPIRSSLYPQIGFELRVDILAQGDGIARIRMDEVDSKTPFKRYNETARWVLLDVNPPLASLGSVRLDSNSDTSTITYGGGSGLSLQISHSPLKITQLRNGQAEVVFNGRSLFHMEHFREKDQEKIEEMLSDSEQMVLKGGEQDRSWFEEHDVDRFEEKFKKWTDSKPKGRWSLSNLLMCRTRGSFHRPLFPPSSAHLRIARTRHNSVSS